MFDFIVISKMPVAKLYEICITETIKQKIKVHKGAIPESILKDIKMFQLGLLKPDWKTKKHQFDDTVQTKLVQTFSERLANGQRNLKYIYRSPMAKHTIAIYLCRQL